MDLLLNTQWRRLLEIRRLQLELMTELGHRNSGKVSD